MLPRDPIASHCFSLDSLCKQGVITRKQHLPERGGPQVQWQEPSQKPRHLAIGRKRPLQEIQGSQEERKKCCARKRDSILMRKRRLRETEEPRQQREEPSRTIKSALKSKWHLQECEGPPKETKASSITWKKSAEQQRLDPHEKAAPAAK